MNPDNETPAHDGDLIRRAAMRNAASRLLKRVAQGGEHESVVAISAADAMDELIPVLDRLLAVGDAAFVQNTAEGWRGAHRRTLDPNVLVRVIELRHAIGATMNYVPGTSGDRDAVVAWLMSLRNLKAQIQPDANQLSDAADVRYLEGLIDGSGDLLAEDTFGKVEFMFIKYAEGSDMHALLTKACNVYSDAAEAASLAAAHAEPTLQLSKETHGCGTDLSRPARCPAQRESSEAARANTLSAKPGSRKRCVLPLLACPSRCFLKL